MVEGGIGELGRDGMKRVEEGFEGVERLEVVVRVRVGSEESIVIERRLFLAWFWC